MHARPLDRWVTRETGSSLERRGAFLMPWYSLRITSSSSLHGCSITRSEKWEGPPNPLKTPLNGK